MRSIGVRARWPSTPDDIRRLVETLGEMTEVLVEEAPEDKAAVYAELGVNVTYHPDQRLVLSSPRSVYNSACRRAGYR
jgi:hypothetical protein